MTLEPNTQSTVRGPGRPSRDESDAGGEVRERLLDAATELAVEQGFDACGLREIAARAEVSSGMIAYYFGDRSGLYEAMFQRAFDRISAQVRAAMNDPESSTDDRLDELIRIQVTSIAADPWLPRLLIREMLARGESPMTSSAIETIGEGPMRLMIDWLIEEQDQHGLRSDLDPRLLAVSIASLSAFPFLVVPIVGERIGLELDEDFPSKLIEHNQKILASGLRSANAAGEPTIASPAGGQTRTESTRTDLTPTDLTPTDSNPTDLAQTDCAPSENGSQEKTR